MSRRTAVLIVLWLLAVGLGTTLLPSCFSEFTNGIQAQGTKRAAVAGVEG